MDMKIFPTTSDEAKAVIAKAYGMPFEDIDDPIDPELLLIPE